MVKKRQITGKYLLSYFSHYNDNASIINIDLYVDNSYIPNTTRVLVDDGDQLGNSDFQVTNYPLLAWDTDEVITQYSNASDRLQLLMIPQVKVANTCEYQVKWKPGFIITNGYCQKDPRKITKIKMNKGRYDMVIGICHTSTGTFGHFICDTLQFMSLIPKELLSKAYFITNSKAPFMNEYLELIGMNPNNIISLNSQEFISVNYYITTPMIPCNTQNIFTIQHLKKIIIKAFNLTHKKTFRYVILQRDYRIVKNKGLNEMIMNEFNQVTWEIFTPKKTLRETANYFNEISLLFLVHGSAIANSIFMQEGSVICEVQIRLFQPFYVATLVGLGINLVSMRDPTMNLFTEPTYPVPNHLISNMIHTGFSLLKQGTKKAYV